MRRVLVGVICLALLAACGEQEGDSAAEPATMTDETDAPNADKRETSSPADRAEMQTDDGDAYVEDEGGGAFGEPMTDDADLADAAAPMDDAQGIDPHTEMGGDEYASDY